MSSSARPQRRGLPFTESLQRFGSVITVVAIAVFGFWGGHFLLPSQEHVESAADETNAPASQSAKQVILSEEKLDAASLKTMHAVLGPFQAHKAIPGTLAYDATRKVELRATVDCFVSKAMVRLNQHVELGATLLQLSGPDVSSAKSEISQCKSTVELLEKEFQWTAETHANIKQLLVFLAQSPTSGQIKNRFGDKKLGEHRSEILAAYAELTFAKRLAKRTNRLEALGVIPGKEADRRRSDLDVAEAKFNSIHEEMTFQIGQQFTRSESNLRTAKKQLAIFHQQLNALVGPNFDSEKQENESPSAVADNPIPKSSSDFKASRFALVAPRSGQIVSLQAAESSRFEPGEVMVEIADVSHVWVEAQVSQRDWHSLNLASNQKLTIRVVGLPDESFTAVVKHVGASVSKATLAIPLVAELDNSKAKFRPGMSVWVDVPISEHRDAITVPEGAIQRNGTEAFVFVKSGASRFEKRDVEIGMESGGSVEILSGLEVGERVVTEGAFFLKSELLLAAEE